MVTHIGGKDNSTIVSRNNPFPVEIVDSDLTSEYKINDLDESSIPEYYGFSDSDGNWIILEVNDTNGTIRYAKGTSNYTTNWTNRAGLTYDYYHNVF